jgi:hypothetical protein
VEVDPNQGAAARPHQAACHFPGLVEVPDADREPAEPGRL